MPRKPPEEPQERSRSPTGIRPEVTGQEETRADKSRQEQRQDETRQEADKRSSGATKPRTPWPVSNLLLVHLMHGSTLVYLYNVYVVGLGSLGGAFALLVGLGGACAVRTGTG